MSGGFVGVGRFAVGAKQHFAAVHLLQLCVVYRHQSFIGQTLHLLLVVHNVAKAAEVLNGLQLFFGFFDGVYHSKTKARCVVYLDGYHFFLLFRFSLNSCGCVVWRLSAFGYDEQCGVAQVVGQGYVAQLQRTQPSGYVLFAQGVEDVV